MHRGRHNEYYWLSSPRGLLHSVIEAVPELVLGRIVAISSFDSGPLTLSDEEVSAGWVSREALAISPPVCDPSDLPSDQFDEWYIFREAVPPTPKLEVFVNYGGFSLSPPSLTRPPQDPTWDRIALRESERLVSGTQARFWSQLESLAPLAYLAEGDQLTVVTKSESEHKRAWAALGGTASEHAAG